MIPSFIMSFQLIVPLHVKRNSDCDDEKELLQQVADGDEKAFTQLFDRYQNKVFSHALTFMKSGEEAEEMVTDIFMKVWNRRSDLPLIENFKSYLFILGRNHLVSAIRKKVMTTVETNTDQWYEDILQPDKQYHFKETHQIIMQGIEQLSPQQKRVFKMSRLDGLTYDEIAERLAISRRTVKFHIILALNYLREYARNNHLSYLLVIIFLFAGR